MWMPPRSGSLLGTRARRRISTAEVTMPRKTYAAAVVWLAASSLACVQGELNSLEQTASPLEEEVAGAGAVDPGPRGGPVGAGGPAPGLTADEVGFFAAAPAKVQEMQSGSGTVAG